jgi:hypothetical protein
MINIAPKISNRAWENWRNASGRITTIAPPRTAPHTLPIPPMATAIKISSDSLNPKLGGEIAVSAGA